MLINNESVTCPKKCLFWGILQPIIGSGSSSPLSPARRFSTAEFAIPVLAAVVALQVRVVLERESGLEGIKSSKQFHRPANVWSEHNVRTTRKSMILAQGLRSHHIQTCSSNSSFLQGNACSRYQGCMMLTSRASTKASWSTSPPLEVLIMQVVGRILDKRLRDKMPSVVGFRLAHLRSRRFRMRWTLNTQQLTTKQHQEGGNTTHKATKALTQPQRHTGTYNKEHFSTVKHKCRETKEGSSTHTNKRSDSAASSSNVTCWAPTFVWLWLDFYDLENGILWTDIFWKPSVSLSGIFILATIPGEPEQLGCDWCRSVLRFQRVKVWQRMNEFKTRAYRVFLNVPPHFQTWLKKKLLS